MLCGRAAVWLWFAVSVLRCRRLFWGGHNSHSSTGVDQSFEGVVVDHGPFLTELEAVLWEVDEGFDFLLGFSHTPTLRAVNHRAAVPHWSRSYGMACHCANVNPELFRS